MIDLFLVDVSTKENFGWEVVGVAVEEHSGRVSALGISLAVAFSIFEELLVKNVGAVEVPFCFRGYPPDCPI